MAVASDMAPGWSDPDAAAIAVGSLCQRTVEGHLDFFTTLLRRPGLGTETRHSARHKPKRAKVLCGMAISLEMGEVIAGIAVLGAFGAEVFAGRGGLD